MWFHCKKKKKRLLLFIKMRFHPQKQQIKNRRWKNKIGFLLFALECFARAIVVRKDKENYLSDRGKYTYFLSLFSFIVSSAFMIPGLTTRGHLCWHVQGFRFFSISDANPQQQCSSRGCNGTILTPNSSKAAWGQTFEDRWDTWEHLHWVQTQSPAGLDSGWVTALWGSLQITK